jgi:hypothetical protein
MSTCSVWFQMHTDWIGMCYSTRTRTPLGAGNAWVPYCAHAHTLLLLPCCPLLNISHGIASSVVVQDGTRWGTNKF